VVRLAPDGYCSFSGGIVDGGHQAFHGINATNQSIALIDSVDIRGSVGDGIRTKGRFGKCPFFINGCTVCDNGKRGIWIHVAREVNALNNVCVGNGSDGIDLDAYAVDCNVLFNISAGNHRHGVFVEEGVRNDIIFGNNLLGNYGSGIAVWDEAVHGNTGQNVIAANFCQRNRAGISVGGRTADETANDNLLFNDLCVDNRDGGLILRDCHASDNYFAQFVIYGNHGQKIHTLGKCNSFF
jgi:Right handed beta helix region